MKDNFDTALALVVNVEKGFVDNPSDPGGATNRGVTQAVYDRWRSSHGLPLQSVRLITEVEVEAIYRSEYWDVANCDALPSGVDYCVFDFAVNSGPGRALKFLAHVLYGDASKASSADPALLCFALCFSRLRFMQSLSTWPVFGKGWSARMVTVLYQSLKLCSTTALHT